MTDPRIPAPFKLWGMPGTIDPDTKTGPVTYGDFSDGADVIAYTNWLATQILRIAQGAAGKEAADLTDTERFAIIYCAGAKVEITTEMRDGELVLLFKTPLVGIVKVDGKFIVGERV